MDSNNKAWVTGIEQIWLINLDRRRDRLDGFMQAHPEMTGRVNRLPAYDGKNLQLTPALARLFAPNNFNWHKPTMGCALSHLSLWQRLATEPNDQTSFLILEDDARLRATWVSTVEQTFLSGSVPPDWEILFLGGILPQYRESFARNVQPINSMVARVHPDSVFGNNPRGYFHFCAYAYLLNARGARRLLNLLHSWNGFWLQADFVAAYHTPELTPPHKIYFFHPLIAESFQDTEQGLARPYDENQGQESKVDSDIWKNDDRFSPDEIAAIKTDGLPLDIPAALGWVPDEALSLKVVAQEASQKLSEAQQSKQRPSSSKIQGIDKIWVINLERRKDRLEKFLINNPDIADQVSILNAYDGKKLFLTPKIARLFAPNDFKWKRAKIACCLSHLDIWVRLANEEDEKACYLILEDDAVLEPEWASAIKKNLENKTAPLDRDVIYLGGSDLDYEHRKHLLEQLTGNIYQVAPNSNYGQSPHNRYHHFCAYAYLLNRQGARKTLELLKRGNGFWCMNDHVLAYRMPEGDALERGVYFFQPRLASCYQEKEQGFAPLYADSVSGGIVDSDIWLNEESFPKEQISYDPNAPLDFVGALLDACMTKPNGTAISAKFTSSLKSDFAIQTWLINLERRKDRLDKFKTNNPDIAEQVSILKAYDGKKLALTPKIARLFAPNDFAWNKATMGCSLSHLELWHKLANESDEVNAYLILEDDTKLSPGWQDIVQKAFQENQVPENWDVLYLGGVLPRNIENFGKLIEPVSENLAQVKENSLFGQNPANRYFHFGAFAYILSKHGARQILELMRLGNGAWMQADYLASYIMPENHAMTRRVFFFNPLLAHCYQDVEEGFAKSYGDSSQYVKVDSDIWHQGSQFDAEYASSLINLQEPHDIAGALADARRDLNFDTGQSCDSSADLCKAKEGELGSSQKIEYLFSPEDEKFINKLNQSIKIAIGINVFGSSKNQCNAIECLKKIKNQNANIEIYNFAFSNELVHVPDFINLGILAESSSDLTGNLNTRKPVANEILNLLSENHCDYFFFLNSDILLSQKALNLVQRGAFETYIFSRYEVDPISSILDPLHLNKLEVAGFDAWAIKTEWWRNNKDKVPKCIYSEPAWDNILSLSLYTNSHSMFCNKEFYIGHVSHPIKWNRDSPEGAFNMRVWNRMPIAPKWEEFLQKYLFTRPPVGAFLNPHDNEEKYEKEFLKNNRNKMKYSQYNEQDVLEEFFGTECGTLWDFGCNDGKTLSNSFHLLTNNRWRGVLVDASPICIERAKSLYQNRSDIQILNIGLSAENGFFDFYESGTHLGNDDLALVSSFKKEETIKWGSSTEYFEKKIQCYDFKTFYSELTQFKTADFISIDIEGLDYEILSSINLNETRTRLVCVEYNGVDVQKYINYCKTFGFEIVAQNSVNLLMGRKITHLPIPPPKALANDFFGRFREIVSDPLNHLIQRDPRSGLTEGNDVILHTGLKVPISGENSYYQEFSKIFILNRGVHEPLEEFVFQELVKLLHENPLMLELGSYWAHYSMWLKFKRPKAKVCMVEPDSSAMQAGTYNFKRNGLDGEFINDIVQTGRFEVDEFIAKRKIDKIDILHSDIQGYEVQMLNNSNRALQLKKINYLFVSTHSQLLHSEVCEILKKYGYRIEVEADFDNDSTAMDGFVFASSPLAGQVFQNFKPMGRGSISNSSSSDVIRYLQKLINIL